MDIVDNVLKRIGFEFDQEVGTYVHKKTNIPVTVYYDDSSGEIVLLDQVKIPYEVTSWRSTDWRKAAWDGIKGMIVRGSQAIGCAAGYVMLLASNSVNSIEELENAAGEIKRTRPTASPLFWAVDITMDAAKRAYKLDRNMDSVRNAVKEAADYILASDLILCQYLVQEGLKFIEDGDVVMTHCNGGSLSSS